jgi:hypothetical protein
MFGADMTRMTDATHITLPRPGEVRSLVGGGKRPGLPFERGLRWMPFD